MNGVIKRALEKGDLIPKAFTYALIKMGYSNWAIKDLEIRNKMYNKIERKYADILEKFDFENFLNKPSKKYNSEKNTKVQEYKKLSSNKNTYERISISYLEDIEKLKKELEKAEKSLEYYQESIKKEEEEIKNLFK